ncbi:MAG: SH3 domain-containing protein [Candidatus Aminicenantes bacterium]|nr:SH3 domain-containing protein [Candidatus Aminicenantes bacterium]
MRKTKKGFVFFTCLIILLLLPEVSQAEKLNVKIVVDNAIVRLKPDMGSMVIGTVPLGTILESEEQVDGWFRVSLPPDEKGYIVTGYIHSIAVEIVEEEMIEEVPARMSPVSPLVETEEPSRLPTIGTPPGPGVSFGLKLSGGMGYLSVGDLNASFQGWNDYFEEAWFGVEGGAEGEYQLLHWGYDFSGEIIVYPIPELGIALGAGYMQVSKESNVKVSTFFGTEEISATPRISAIPITLGVYFTPPLGSGVNLILSAGAGYYIGQMSWEREVSDIFGEFTDTWKTNKGTLGFQGSLGFEFAFSPKIAFVIEGCGRYAKLKDLSGDFKRAGTGILGPFEWGGEYTMWYYEYSDNAESYPRVYFFEEEPDNPNYRNIRKAEIDLSGFSVKAGFRFRF